MAGRTETTPHDDRLATIRALLAKAEATDFPAEAEAFCAKATELMARYSIDEAMVWAEQGGGSEIGELVIVLHRPYVNLKAWLVHGVAAAFGCRSVGFAGSGSGPMERVSVVGFPSDLELVDTLVTSLLVQQAAAMLAAQPASSSASASAAWRRSFLGGYADTVRRRLEEQRSAAAHHDGPGGSTAPVGSTSTELVLVRREEAVDGEFRRRFPRLRQSRVSMGTSGAGRSAGAAAGRRADLGSRRIARRRALSP